MKHIAHYIKKYPWLLLLVLPAFFIYMLIIFPSGSSYCVKGVKCGIYFWGVHGHDGIWHLAIANAAFNKIPFAAPTFAGANLTGYNYLLDLVIYLFTRLGLPAIVTYFKILPVTWFVVYTILLVILARKIRNNPVFVGLFLFFAYFADSFSYVLNLWHRRTIWGSAGLLSTMKVHMMSNPPFAFSVLIRLSMLIIIKNQKVGLKTVIALGGLNFLNLGLKFYGGAVTTFLLAVYLFFTFAKKDWRKLAVYAFIQLLFFGAAVVLFYDPFSSVKSGAIFTVSPFALVHPITEEQNLFYLRKLTDARYFLASRGIGPKLIVIEMVNLFLFLFFYLGVKFFGLIYVFGKILRKKLTAFDFYLILTMVFATVLSVTLVQKAEWWNVIQFFHYVIFLAVIFTAELAYELFKTKKFRYLSLSAVFFMLILSLPVTADVIREYAAFPGAAYLPAAELSALDFLKKQPDGVILTPLYDRSIRDPAGPNELYRYEDTAYVAAFTGKELYLANILQLRLTGVDYENRLREVKENDCRLLTKVTYLYQNNILPINRRFFGCPLKLKRLFVNEGATVYGVEK